MAGIKPGWKASGMSSTVVGGEDVSDLLSKFDTTMSDTGNTLFRKIEEHGADAMSDQYEKFLVAGLSQDEAFIKAVMRKRVPNEPQDATELAAMGRHAIGLESLDDFGVHHLDDFASRHTNDVATSVMRQSASELNKEFVSLKEEFGDTLGFKFGKKVKDLQRNIFQAQSPVDSIKDGIKQNRSLDAQGSEFMAAMQTALHKATLHDAEKLGLDVADAEKLFMMDMEWRLLQDELGESTRQMFLTGDVAGKADALQNFAARSLRLTDMAQAAMADNPLFKEAAAKYGDIASALGTGTKLRQFLDENAVLETIGEIPKLGGSRTNQRLVRMGSNTVHAGNMSDRAIEQVVKRHIRNGTPKKPTGAQIQKQLDKFKTLQELQAEFPIVANNASALMAEFDLTASDVLHNLKRARTGKIAFLTAAKGQAYAVKGRRFLPEAERARWIRAAQELTPEVKPTFNPRNLSEADLAEYRDLKNLLELRATGKEARLKKSTAPIERIENLRARDNVSIWDETPPSFKGDDVGLAEVPDGAKDIARIIFGAAEMRRAGHLPTPAFMDDLNDAAVRLSQTLSKPMDEVMEATGATKLRDLSQEVRASILNEAMEHGLITAGAPMAYVGHIIGRSGTMAIAEALQRSEVRNVLSEAMPQLSSSFGRNMDSLPVEDLNTLYHVLSVANNPAAQETADLIRKTAENKGLVLGKFETSPAQALATRLSQGVTTYSTAKSAKTMLNAARDAGQVIGGRVVRVIHGSGKRIADELTRLDGKVKHTKGDQATLDITTKENAQRVSGFVLKQDDGTHKFLPFNAAGAVGGFLPLGARTHLTSALKAGTGDVAGIEKALDSIELSDAFSLRANRGEFKTSEIVDLLDDAAISKLEGQHVLFGDKEVIGGMFNAAQRQWKHTGEISAAFDTATFAIKKWQTVYRPGFAITNMGGTFFQARSLGVSVKNSFMGMLDAIRFMHGDPKLAAAYNRTGLHTASEAGLTGLTQRRIGKIPGTSFSLLPTTEAARTIRAAGFEGVPEVTPEVLEKFGVTAEDLVFRAGGQIHDLGEMFDVMAREGLLATFIQNGLKGSSSVSESMFRLRQLVIDPSKLSKFSQRVDAATEASEVFSRFGVTFAQLREGVDMEHAVINAKAATVDYTQLTDAEQMLKRVIPFYTFPRHYIPHAAKHFAENPRALAMVDSFLKSAQNTGVIAEENGNVVFDFDGMMREVMGMDTDTNWGANISRLNPNLETVKYLEAFGEIMLNVSDDVSTLVGAGGVQAARAEELSGQTHGPIGTGGLVPAAFEAISGGDFVKELSDSVWATRIMFAPEDPLGEKTTMSQLLDSVLLGTKTPRPLHEAKLIDYQYKRIISTLNKNAKASNDPKYIAELQAEAQRLQSIARDRISKIRK